jgi:hypothetical protein
MPDTGKIDNILPNGAATKYCFSERTTSPARVSGWRRATGNLGPRVMEMIPAKQKSRVKPLKTIIRERGETKWTLSH